MMNVNEFAKRLKEARTEAHMTQDELAKRLNMSKSTISMWENGNRIPSINAMIPLSKVLHRPPSFFTGESVRILSDGSTAPGIAFKPSNDMVINDGFDTLIEAYNSLNEEGMKRLSEYAKDLISSGRYERGG